MPAHGLAKLRKEKPMINTIAWLSEDEVVSHRLQTFHRERVEAIIAGQTPAKIQKGGLLVVHLVPLECAKTPFRLDTDQLNAVIGTMPVLSSSFTRTRFNVDGVVAHVGEQGARGYSQLYRDGRLESVMSAITYSKHQNDPNGLRCLRDWEIEPAMFTVVGKYLKVCKLVGRSAPIRLLSTIAGCEDVHICTDFSFGDLSETGIDRKIAFLPDVEIESLEDEPQKALRAWCDSLWQACGIERSFNFDAEGNWRSRRR